MRILKALVFCVLALGVLAFAATHEPAREPGGNGVLESPPDADPVYDADGYLREWEGRTPRDIDLINQGRKAVGLAKGPMPKP